MSHDYSKDWTPLIHRGNRLEDKEVIVSQYRHSDFDRICREVNARYPGMQMEIDRTSGKFVLIRNGRARRFLPDRNGRYNVLSILRAAREISTRKAR